jgi:hypothetical protein
VIQEIEFKNQIKFSILFDSYPLLEDGNADLQVGNRLVVRLVDRHDGIIIVVVVVLLLLLVLRGRRVGVKAAVE